MLSLSNDPYARTVSAGMSERRARTRARAGRLCRALQAAIARLRPGREDCLAWERGQAGNSRIISDQRPCAEKVLCALGPCVCTGVR